MNLAALLHTQPAPIPACARKCGPGWPCKEPKSARSINYGRTRQMVLDFLRTRTAPMSIPAIAALSGIAASSVQKAVYELEAEGLVRVDRASPRRMFAEVVK